MPTPELRQKVVAEERRVETEVMQSMENQSLECSERWAVYRGDGLLVDMK